jgi:hypothetical protein
MAQSVSNCTALIVRAEEIVPLKDKFFDLIRSTEEDVRTITWEYISSYNFEALIRSNIFSRDDNNTFLDLLQIIDEKIRSHAWYSTSYLIESNIVKAEEIVPLKDRFFKLLESTDDKIRYTTWNQTMFEAYHIYVSKNRQYIGCISTTNMAVTS